MERCAHVLLLCVFLGTIGGAVSVSSKAFRSWTSKVNLLTLEVLDLKTELELERARTARLEELLGNGTEINGNTDEPAPSEPENGDPMVPDSSQRIIDGAAVHMLDKAFRDLKHEVKEFEASVTTSLDNRADATSALGSRVDDLNITLMRADNTANANGNDIAEQRIGLEEVSNKVKQVQQLCDEDIDAVKARLADVALELEENAHNIGENRNAAMQLQQTLSSSKVKQSAFTYNGPIQGYNPCRFTDRVSDIGNDYSSTTGKFTCEFPGIYVFMLSLTKVRSDDANINDYVAGAIRVNGVRKVRVRTDPQDDSDNGSHEATATLAVHLDTGDVVDVSTSSQEKSYGSISQFTGFLLQAD